MPSVDWSGREQEDPELAALRRAAPQARRGGPTCWWCGEPSRPHEAGDDDWRGYCSPTCLEAAEEACAAVAVEEDGRRAASAGERAAGERDAQRDAGERDPRPEEA